MFRIGTNDSSGNYHFCEVSVKTLRDGECCLLILLNSLQNQRGTNIIKTLPLVFETLLFELVLMRWMSFTTNVSLLSTLNVFGLFMINTNAGEATCGWNDGDMSGYDPRGESDHGCK